MKYWPYFLTIISAIFCVYTYTYPNERWAQVLGMIGGLFLIVGVISSFILLGWVWGIISIPTAFIVYRAGRH